MDATSDRRVADPTALTTSQIQREVGALEKLLSARIEAVEKAIEIAHENLVRVPTDVEKSVGHLSQIMNEKFAGTMEKFTAVQMQLHERDLRREQAQKDSKGAVDAALQAAKEAVSKQEAATTKQLEAISEMMRTNTKATDEKIDDLKQRLGRIEGQELGQKTAITTQQTNNNSLVGVIGLVIGSLVGVGGLVVAIFNR